MQVSFPNPSSNTCPLKQVLVFLGDYSPEFLEIEKFFDTTDAERLTAAAKETGYSFSLHDEDHYEYAIFNLKSPKMQPAVWIAFKDSAYKDKIHVKLA